ncbi:hypothetical protein D6833_04125 [Candidatus Parcubacteria bacterium]|nr:MAG: hypothetical protein D6833_04125 [Candidatus Parcubacteria bacterium]
MAGIKALRKIQLGRETTAGTAVAATTIWRGMGVLDDQREVIFPEEDIGYLSGVDRTYIPKYLAGMTFEEVEATFEQLPHVFEAGIATATPTQDGTGSGYIYTYTFPTTAANTIKTYTIEGGDNQQAWEMEYSHVANFALSGVAGEAWKVSAEWVGRQATPTSFTGSVSLPSVEEMLFSKTKLYVDDDSGTIGTTQISNTLLEANITVTTGLVPQFTADGNLYFSYLANVAPEVLLEVVFVHNGSAHTERTNWINETARQVRLLCEGSALSTPGTSYSYKTAIFDMAGKWERFEPLDERDGSDVVSARFRARYNSTAALFAQFVIVNELTSLP